MKEDIKELITGLKSAIDDFQKGSKKKGDD